MPIVFCQVSCDAFLSESTRPFDLDWGGHTFGLERSGFFLLSEKGNCLSEIGEALLVFCVGYETCIECTKNGMEGFFLWQKCNIITLGTFLVIRT